MMLLQVADVGKPLDIVALVQVTFTGLALLISSVGGIYAAIAASRAKRAVDATAINATDIKLIERNTNSMTTEIARLSRKEGSAEGERKGLLAGQEASRLLEEGRRQGREERDRQPLVPPQDGPVPVADDRTAVAAERSAAATERVATAAEEKK